MITNSLCIVVLFAAFGNDTADKDAVGKVQEGLKKFEAGQFDPADKLFAEANDLAPNNARIQFDRGCAALAQLQLDQAKEWFEKSALAKDTNLAAASYYNLGILAVRKAQAALGEQAENANPSSRKAGLSELADAIRYFRDCLKLDPNHAEARKNLELIRLWIKYIQQQWAEKDRKEKQNEKNPLDLLHELLKKEIELRANSRQEKQKEDSTQRRDSLQQLAKTQTELVNDLAPLQTKLEQAIKQAMEATQQAPPKDENGKKDAKGATPKPNADQMKPVLNFFNHAISETKKDMESAAKNLRENHPKESVGDQTKSIEKMRDLLAILGDFGALLNYAIATEQQLVDGAAAQAEPEKTADKSDDDRVEEQRFVGKLAQTLGQRALSMQAQMQAAEHPPAPLTPSKRAPPKQADQKSVPQKKDGEKNEPPKKTDEKNAQPAAKSEPPRTIEPKRELKPDVTVDPNERSQEQQAQDAMRKAVDKAVKNAPQVKDLSEKASKLLESNKDAEAKPLQEKALKLLKEIADEMPPKPNEDSDSDQKDKQQQQQDKGKKNQQKNSKDQDQQKQIEDEKSKEEQEKQSEKDKKEKDKKGKDKDGKEKDKKESKKQNGEDELKLAEEEKARDEDKEQKMQKIEAMLQKAKEREKARRAQNEKLEVLKHERTRVKKDW